MKRTLLALTLLLALASAGLAQTVKRPALLFTPDRIDAAKRRVQNEPVMAQAWGELRQRADSLSRKRNLADAEYVALAYLMTGDSRYADWLKNTLLAAVKAEAWASAEMLARVPAWHADLNVAHKAYYSAIAYDAVYGELSGSERKEIARGLKRLALDPLMDDWVREPTRIHSLNSMGHNWWTSCVGMGGLLALSLRDDLPEAREAAATVNRILPQWFSFGGDVLQRKPRTFDRDGGMYESLNYANFGIQEALLFRLAWKNVYPRQAMPDIPQLALLPDFFLHVCYLRTGVLYNINLGDSHKNITAESSLMLLHALGVKNDNMLWYFAQVRQGQNRDGYFINRPMGFLYTPQLDRAPETPKLAKEHLFADFGWATMRTSWEKDATMLTVKSGYTWNHSHADANSFILFHKGVDILKDAGNCWYPNPAYRGYFFQSRAHNVVLFDGEGQPTEQQYHGSSLRGQLYDLMADGDIRYVLADGTGPYADNFSRNFRHFLWIDNVVYVVDDLKTHRYGSFEWLWHPGGETRKRGADFEVTNGKSSVVIRPLFPRQLALSDFVHDYPEDLWWEQIEAPTEDLKGTESYWSFHLPGKRDRVKAVNAIILKDSAAQRELPRMERREGKDWIGLRVYNKGKVTDIYINQLADGRLMHSNSWIEADGWTTDAYMLAVSYPEGTEAAKSEDMFVCYGSALRRGDTSYFSSLAKQTVIARGKDKSKWIVRNNE
ncbi:MAG: heparinase II/III-family protein [Mediterranea sp.]|jgi:hypothetical protein|nr:heparinase II/III-family protein [Mediterranea sp.]